MELSIKRAHTGEKEALQYGLLLCILGFDEFAGIPSGGKLIFLQVTPTTSFAAAGKLIGGS